MKIKVLTEEILQLMNDHTAFILSVPAHTDYPTRLILRSVKVAIVACMTVLLEVSKYLPAGAQPIVKVTGPE